MFFVTYLTQTHVLRIRLSGSRVFSQLGAFCHSGSPLISPGTLFGKGSGEIPTEEGREEKPQRPPLLSLWENFPSWFFLTFVVWYLGTYREHGLGFGWRGTGGVTTNFPTLLLPQPPPFFVFVFFLCSLSYRSDLTDP